MECRAKQLTNGSCASKLKKKDSTVSITNYDICRHSAAIGNMLETKERAATGIKKVNAQNEIWLKEKSFLLRANQRDLTE